jgi:hypothetical protein
MATTKEQCFEEALDEYQKASGKDLNIKHRQPWVQGLDGTWRQESRGFWAGVNSMMKTIQYRLGLGPAPGSSQQVRVPDLTIGDKVVADTKFTRADGTVDKWGTKPGAGNQNNQLDDYNDINEQQNPGNKDAKNVALDPESCNCKGRSKAGEPQKVQVTQYESSPSPSILFVPLPSGVPGGVPVPELPSLPPVWEPIFVP